MWTANSDQSGRMPVFAWRIGHFVGFVTSIYGIPILRTFTLIFSLIVTCFKVWWYRSREVSGSVGTYRGVTITETRDTAVGIVCLQPKISRLTPAIYHMENELSHEKRDLNIMWFEILQTYMSHVMRKPVYALCEQKRRRSACASVQSDQRLSCSLLR